MTQLGSAQTQFFHKLIASKTKEVVFAHFQDPEASRKIALSISATAAETVTERRWSATVISAMPTSSLPARLNISIPVNQRWSGFSKLIGAFRLEVGCDLEIFAVVGEHRNSLAKDIHGTGQRYEVSASLDSLAELTQIVDSIEIEITRKDISQIVISLLWLGLAADSPISSSDILNRSEHTHFFRDTDLSKPKFARKLLFDESGLSRARGKLKFPVWAAHYSHLLGFAKQCMLRDPSESLAEYLPSYDTRFVREHERDRKPYYWEALAVAFVGLLEEDPDMIRQAQRYLLCMLDTPVWFSSAEEVIATSSWDARAFVPELTVTSISILWDWLGFTFEPELHNIIARALWRRGMAPVQGDLMKYPYMKNMNQGAVFSRALVMGALMLERRWDMVGYADEWYSTMTGITAKIVNESDAYKEGPIYFTQLAHALMPPILAWSRARNRDWRKEVKRMFAGSLAFLETLGQSTLGFCTPLGDSRIDALGGDLFPVLAGIMPKDSYLNHIAAAGLESGAVFRSSGTMKNSGGILSLVYGPDKFLLAKPYSRPTLQTLKRSGITRNTRNIEDHEVSILVVGFNSGAGHSHADVGSFVLEVDDLIIFSDPGMIEYGQLVTDRLRGPECHNVLFPKALEGGEEHVQQSTSHRVIRKIKSSGSRFSVSLRLDGVWEPLKIYTREVNSSTADEIEVNDIGKTDELTPLVFRLVTPFKAEISGASVFVHFPGGRARVDSPWATQRQVEPGPKSLNGDALSLITLESEPLNNFKLKTKVGLEIDG